MSETLLKRYGSWDKVCEHVATKIKIKDKTGFIDWLKTHEHYSPSGYEKGMFGDPLFYQHIYTIVKKMRSGSNQQHMLLVSGKIGKGKSTLALQASSLSDSTFNMERVCYVPPHLFRRLYKCHPGEALLVDEGGNFFKGRNAMTKLGKDVSAAFQLVRDLNQIIVVCYDEPEKLDGDIIDKFDSMLIKTYSSNEKGDRKYRYYLGFGSSAMDKVKALFKKKIGIKDSRVLSLASWRGHNTKEIPIVNDLNEGIYRSEKTKFLKEHMKVLEDRYKDEYLTTDKPKVEDEPDKQFIDIRKASKLTNYSADRLKKKIHSGELKGYKLGSKWLLDKHKLIKDIESHTLTPDTSDL